MAIRAVLDACVLFPEWLRDLFLRCAEAGLLRVAWTNEILDELRRNLESERGLPPEKTSRLVQAMERAFPDASVESWQEHVAAMTNHVKDRHVMAAAYAIARAEGSALVVTANLRDFPKQSWPGGVTVVTPDDLLSELARTDTAAVVDIVWEHARRRRRPPVSVTELMAGLAVHAPRFVQSLDGFISIRTEEQLEAISERLVRAHGESPAEFLVALADLSLADPEFHQTMRAKLKEHSLEFAEATLMLIRDPRMEAMSRQLLRERGVSLPLEDVRRLSAQDFEALLEQTSHTKQ